MMIAAKVGSKCFDYSIFRVAKEILYIPLSRDEKTKGKALIDILTFRIAKGFSSLLLLFFAFFALSQYLMEFIFSLQITWLVLTFIIIRRYRQVMVNNSSMSEV